MEPLEGFFTSQSTRQKEIAVRISRKNQIFKAIFAPPTPSGWSGNLGQPFPIHKGEACLYTEKISGTRHCTSYLPPTLTSTASESLCDPGDPLGERFCRLKRTATVGIDEGKHTTKEENRDEWIHRRRKTSMGL